MASAGSVDVEILGDDSGLQSALRSSAAKVAAWAAVATTAAAGVGVAMVRSGLASADALAKQAAQLQTTSIDLAVLQRAADMAGISQEKLAGASRALTGRLGQAASGAGPAADALNRLGLSAAEVAALPLSERIGAITTALKANVPANERAAVAAQLFGEEAGLAIATLNADTISTAAAQVAKFGSALSEVDAAKIEAANDAMSQVGLATDAVTRQLAARFAPVLESVSNLLVAAVVDTGLLQKAIDAMAKWTIKAIGFIGDAFHGLSVIVKAQQVAFVGMGLVVHKLAVGILQAFDFAINGVKELINGVVRAVNKISPLKMDELVTGESAALTKMRGWEAGASEAFARVKGELHDMAMAELPSDRLKQFVDEAEAASTAAAEKAVAAKREMFATVDGAAAGAIAAPGAGGGSAGSDAEANAKKTADDARMREIEAAQAAALSHVEILRERFASEAELSGMKFDEDAASLQEALQLKQITQAEYWELDEALWLEHQDRLNAIEQEHADGRVAIVEEEAAAKQAATQTMMDNLVSLINSGSKKMFQIGKVAAIANAVLKGKESITSAYAAGMKHGGPWVAAAYSAAAGLAVASQINSLRSTSFGGGGGSSPTTTAAPGGGTESSQALAGTGADASTRTGAAQQVTISLVGETFGRAQMRDFIEKINEAVADGAVLRIA